MKEGDGEEEALLLTFVSSDNMMDEQEEEIPEDVVEAVEEEPTQGNILAEFLTCFVLWMYFDIDVCIDMFRYDICIDVFRYTVQSALLRLC